MADVPKQWVGEELRRIHENNDEGVKDTLRKLMSGNVR